MMTTRTDAQLNLYFGGNEEEQIKNKKLSHSQSQANLFAVKISSTSNSLESILNDEDNLYPSDNDDIYSVVAWQLGHDRVGSVSDGAMTKKEKSEQHKKYNQLTNRKGLKWYKKLFRQKTSPIKETNEHNMKIHGLTFVVVLLIGYARKPSIGLQLRN